MVDEDNNLHELTKDEVKKHFELAYALILHQFQGSDTTSYYWTPEDNYFIDGRTAYTIISRLNTKRNKK